MIIEAKTVQVNGRTVRYVEYGAAKGRPIILLHGGFADSEVNWKPAMESLGLEFHAIAPDLPGFGGSAALPGLPGVDRLVVWLKNFMDTLGIEQAVIVGHSFGGLIARVFAASHPDYAVAVVLVDGGVIPNVPPLARFIARIPFVGGFLFGRIAARSCRRPALAGIVAEESAIDDEFASRAWHGREALARLMRGVTLSRVPAARQTPPVPVHVLWGEADGIAPVYVGEFIAKSIPGATINTIAGCGHLPQLEVVDVFTAQISMYLNSIDRQPRNLA